MSSTWTIPAIGNNPSAEELLVAFDQGRPIRVLVMPALFDEANKLRRFTVEVMRRLDRLGIDCLLPDLPGCNESTDLLQHQSLQGWRDCAETAAEQLGVTHVLAIRGGAMVAPAQLPGWHYAPQSGAKTLRGMIRARTIAARESGISETSEQLLINGRSGGLVLGGWRLSAAMISELETAEPALGHQQTIISHADIGGPALWLRAEPDENPAQADTLAAIIMTAIA